MYSRSACNCFFRCLNSFALSLVDAQQAESSMPGMHALCIGLSKVHAARGTLNNQDVYLVYLMCGSRVAISKRSRSPVGPHNIIVYAYIR